MILQHYPGGIIYLYMSEGRPETNLHLTVSNILRKLDI